MSNFSGVKSVGGGRSGDGGGRSGYGGGRSGGVAGKRSAGKSVAGKRVASKRGASKRGAGKSGAGNRIKRDVYSGCAKHLEYLMPGCEDCQEISETNILCADDDVPHGEVCGVYGCDTPLTYTDLGEQCEGCANRNGADGGNAVNGADDE